MTARIGINLLAFEPGRSGGAELYARHLVSALTRIDKKNEYVLFTNLDNDHVYRFSAENLTVHCVRIPTLPQVRRVAVEQMILPVLARRQKLTVLHSPSYTWPVAATLPGIVTIHDMLYRTHPQFVPQPKRAFWNAFVPLSARRCRTVVTISENAKHDIVRLLGIDERKIVVTPLAPNPMVCMPAGAPGSPDTRAILDRYHIVAPFILTVAGLGLHKNSLMLVRALKELHRAPDYRGVSLVITGRDYGAGPEVRREVERLGLGDKVVFAGFVDAADLATLYACCAAYGSMSRFEGFGMTAVEAMACGAPVLVSNCGSLPEVVGDAALLAPPDDVEAIADKIRRFLQDGELRKKYIARGYRRAADFSWDRTARLTLQTYLEAAAQQ